MSHAEVVGNLILLAIAGNETTTKLIGNMAYRLWEHPEQRRWLIEDSTLIPKAIEETLRFDGSSQILVRRVGQDVTLRGKLLRKGDRVGLCVISANRDGENFENPDVSTCAAAPRDHMAFGYGVHACLGAALARLETRVVFEELLRLHAGLRNRRAARCDAPTTRTSAASPTCPSHFAGTAMSAVPARGRTLDGRGASADRRAS